MTHDRADDAAIDDQCRALTSSGDRCQNAIGYMSDGPFCGTHSNADDIETVGDADERIPGTVEGCECDACTKTRRQHRDGAHEPQGSRGREPVRDTEKVELGDFA